MYLLIYLLKYWLTGGHNGARTARRRPKNVVRGRLAATPEPVRKKPASSVVGAATCGLDLLEVCAYRGSVPILIWLVVGLCLFVISWKDIGHLNVFLVTPCLFWYVSLRLSAFLQEEQRNGKASSRIFFKCHFSIDDIPKLGSLGRDFEAEIQSFETAEAAPSFSK